MKPKGYEADAEATSGQADRLKHTQRGSGKMKDEPNEIGNWSKMLAAHGYGLGSSKGSCNSASSTETIEHERKRDLPLTLLVKDFAKRCWEEACAHRTRM